MQLTKFALNDAQFKNFELWLKEHYNYPKYGISLNLVDKFLGHYYGVRMLNWIDQTFVTMTPANASFFILSMSNSANN
jgi:hypothetical protein